MIRINKGSQPKALKRAIKKGVTDYENQLAQDVKNKIRSKLLADQGYVCCYCLKKIPEKLLPKSKIEHFRCQHKYPHLQLDYSNLFVACNGVGNGGVKTCDTKKDRLEINSFDLTKTNFTNLIRYSKDGTILSTDVAIDKEINDVLCLNEENLRLARQNVIIAIQNIKKRLTSGSNYQIQINKQIQNWKERDTSGQFQQFYAVALYFLK